MQRITGYAPDTAHSEKGWMVNCGWEEGSDIGLVSKQDAIYFVSNNMLSVTYCDGRRELTNVGSFKDRVKIKN